VELGLSWVSGGGEGKLAGSCDEKRAKASWARSQRRKEQGFLGHVGELEKGPDAGLNSS
jgi:hypothetical protein